MNGKLVSLANERVNVATRRKPRELLAEVEAAEALVEGAIWPILIEQTVLATGPGWWCQRIDVESHRAASLPQVEQGRYTVPSVICTLIMWCRVRSFFTSNSLKSPRFPTGSGRRARLVDSERRNPT